MATPSLNAPYLTLAGVIVIGLVMIFTVYQPLVGEMKQLRTDIQTNEQKLIVRRAKLEELDRKIADLAAAAAHEAQLNVVLPTDDSVEDMVRIVHDAAAAAQMVVQSISNSSTGSEAALNARRARGEDVGFPPGVTSLAFEIQTNGSYQQLRQFAELIQRSPRLADITELSISRNEQQLDSTSVSLQVRFYKHNPIATGEPS